MKEAYGEYLLFCFKKISGKILLCSERIHSVKDLHNELSK